MKIFTVTTLRDEKNAHIEAYSEFGALMPIFERYVGKAVGKFDVGRGPGQEQIMPYDTIIEASSVEEAFSKYRECTMKRGREIQDEIKADITRQRLAGR